MKSCIFLKSGLIHSVDSIVICNLLREACDVLSTEACIFLKSGFIQSVG